MKRNISDLEMGGESEINLSPMIDCIFILLIFFTGPDPLTFVGQAGCTRTLCGGVGRGKGPALTDLKSLTTGRV